MSQVIAGLFSGLAVICAILRRFADRLDPELMGAFESLLMAASSYLFGVNAAAFAWLTSAFSYLLLFRNRFTPLWMLGMNLLFSILALIFNNSGWLALLPIIAMQWMLARRCFLSHWNYPYHDCDWSSLSRRRKTIDQFFSLQIILAAWIAYGMLIGDWPGIISRFVLAVGNLCLFLKDVFSQENRARRAYVRHHRNYKRHLR